MILQDDNTRMKIEKQALDWAETFNWDRAARKFEKELFDILGVNK